MTPTKHLPGYLSGHPDTDMNQVIADTLKAMWTPRAVAHGQKIFNDAFSFMEFTIKPNELWQHLKSTQDSKK